MAVPLLTSSEVPCPYLPDRIETLRYFLCKRVDGGIYHRFMDASFRRSGIAFYQPVCKGCRACVPLRVQADRFTPSKSQRRAERRNADVSVSIDLPKPTEEKFALYQRYQEMRHEKPEPSRERFEEFLYQSPVQTIEMEYRDAANRLLGVGICDMCDLSLSSVYFYFDPAESHRSLGVFSALQEIALARMSRIPYYYLGFWVSGSAKMQYKTNFRPYEILYPDGVWREPIGIGRKCM
jgi:arginine-tRNA-protein transferase